MTVPTSLLPSMGLYVLYALERLGDGKELPEWWRKPKKKPTTKDPTFEEILSL